MFRLRFLAALVVGLGAAEGLHWNIPVATPPGRDYHPRMVEDSRGNLYVAFEHETAPYDRDILIAKSPNNGMSWFIISTPLYTGAADNYHPSIAVGPGDTLYLVCAGPAPNPRVTGFYWLVSGDGGRTWQYEYIPQWGWYRDCSHPAIGVGGEIQPGFWIAVQHDTGGNQNIRVIYSADRRSFYPPVEVADSPAKESHPVIAVGAEYVLVAYEYERAPGELDILGARAKTDDFQPVVIAADPGVNECHPDIAASGEKFYLGYSRGKDVYLAASIDHGRSFLSYPVAATPEVEGYPAVACSGGEVVVAYIYRSNSLLHRRSRDQGRTWSEPDSVSNRPTVVDTSRSVAVVYNGDSTHISWVDERLGNWDIYYGRPYKGVTGVADGPKASAFPWVSARPLVFNRSTLIEYGLSTPGPVALLIYDATGRRVATLVDGWQEAGLHRVCWEGVDQAGAPVPDGIYFVRLLSQGSLGVVKLIRMREGR